MQRVFREPLGENPVPVSSGLRNVPGPKFPLGDMAAMLGWDRSVQQNRDRIGVHDHLAAMDVPSVLLGMARFLHANHQQQNRDTYS
jgi:hypothetical protein